MTEKVGAIPCVDLIAVSFHRLFLGGLLPSRARFRFTGSSIIHLHIKPQQSRTRQTCHSISVSHTKGAVQVTVTEFPYVGARGCYS
jgi:hypothetical protein